MAIHLTPPELASVLARYAPNKIEHLLEPAVGSGSLLLPFCTNGRQVEQITCIDRRIGVMRDLQKLRRRSHVNLELIVADFISWARKALLRNVQFDCIVMNPPFAARTRRTISLDFESSVSVRRVPLEIAFLIRAVQLLERGGRLLAILPSSAVSSVRNTWMRRWLMQSGSILCVQEVPRYSFKGIERGVFLLTFEKASHRRLVTVCNSDLYHPTEIHISNSALSPHFRLDYSYHNGERQASAAKQEKLGWSSLGQAARIRRGTTESPVSSKTVLHTTDRDGLFWSLARTNGSMRKHCEKPTDVSSGDLLMSRVGRNCAESAGVFASKGESLASDCVHIIRPRRLRDRYPLLFALRIALRLASAKGLLERGTGAAYITQDALRKFEVPGQLHKVFPAAYRSYRAALARRRSDLAMNIEKTIAGKLAEHTDEKH